jgi:hypothetical protein
MASAGIFQPAGQPALSRGARKLLVPCDARGFPPLSAGAWRAHSRRQGASPALGASSGGDLCFGLGELTLTTQLLSLFSATNVVCAYLVISLSIAAFLGLANSHSVGTTSQPADPLFIYFDPKLRYENWLVR